MSIIYNAASVVITAVVTGHHSRDALCDDTNLYRHHRTSLSLKSLLMQLMLRKMLLDNNVINRIPTTTISTSSKSEHFMFFSTLHQRSSSIVKYDMLSLCDVG